MKIVTIKNLILLAVGSAIIVTLLFFTGKAYYNFKYKPDPRINPALFQQTVSVAYKNYIEELIKKAQLKPEYKFIRIETQDPKKLEELIKEAQAYWKQKYLAEFNDSVQQTQFNYVAQADTALQDSILSLNVAYISPIPIHPSGYFQFSDVKMKKKETTVTITNEITKPYSESFWDKFNIVLYGGLGYDPLGKTIGTSIGVGVGFNIKKLF